MPKAARESKSKSSFSFFTLENKSYVVAMTHRNAGVVTTGVKCANQSGTGFRANNNVLNIAEWTSNLAIMHQPCFFLNEYDFKSRRFRRNDDLLLNFHFLDLASKNEASSEASVSEFFQLLEDPLERREFLARLAFLLPFENLDLRRYRPSVNKNSIVFTENQEGERKMSIFLKLTHQNDSI